MSFQNYLVISRLYVSNANALSSPITIGVPSVTALMGAVHKLQRILNESVYSLVKISGVGIVIHDAKLKTFKWKNKEYLVSEGYPIKKNGERASTIPSPKIDMNISLICRIEDDDFQIEKESCFLKEVDEILRSKLKIAGGDILPAVDKKGEVSNSFLETGHLNYFQSIDDYDYRDIRKVIGSVIPGYALIERRDLIIEEMEKGNEALDSMVDYLAIHHECKKDTDGTVKWNATKKKPGWFVPISVGYQGLTEPEEAENQRAVGYPHVFGENLITLGEYIAINSIKCINHIMWEYAFDKENSLYKCICNGGKYYGTKERN